MNKNVLLLGGHISISGGLYKALERGKLIGCTAMQIFTKSNRQWYAKPITQEDINLFKQALTQFDISSVVVHASYLINIASQDKVVLQKSANALKDELQRCDQLGIKYLVLHPGNSGISDQNDSLNRVAETINEIYSKSNIQAVLLLENMAGQGTSIAYQFEQLAKIYNQIKDKKKVGICFDTCHAFASGYDFRTKEAYENMWNEFDKILGINLIKVMHINDSKGDLGCKVDRHEFLAKGKIGKKSFDLLFNDPRLYNVIKILEVPVENIEDYIPDFKFILNLLSEKNIKSIENTNLEILSK